MGMEDTGTMAVFTSQLQGKGRQKQHAGGIGKSQAYPALALNCQDER